MKRHNILFYLYLIILSSTANQLIISNNKLNAITDKIILDDLYILESEYDDGNYIQGDMTSLGFIKYNGKYLPRNKDLKTHMYTIRSTFSINEKLKNEKISILIGASSYPFNVYINGKWVASIGRYKNNYNSTNYYSTNIALPQYILNFNDQPNDISIQIFAQHEINPFSNIILASNDTVTQMVFFRNLFNVHLIQSIFLVAIVLFVFFIFLFVTYRFKEKKYLLFALTCLCFAASYFNISFYHYAINEIILEKISRTGFPLAVMFLAFFIMEYTKILNKNKAIATILIFPNAILTLVMLIQNNKEGLENIFNITTTYLFLPILMFSLILLIISIIKNKNIGSIFIFIGFVAVLITSFKDIITLSNGLVPFAWVVPYGFLTLVISIFFVLSIEQSRVYLQSIMHSAEINNKNEALGKLFNNITEVIKKLSNTSSKLDHNIADTISITKRYGENNQIIIEKVITEFVEIENIISQITSSIDNSNQKIPQALANQTSVVEEITSTMSNINTQIESTMTSVLRSNEAANQLSELATKSTKIINESKESIHKIFEHSRFINDVLNAIEDITEKTNLLAINASIEAANSGIYGKGFSVVADEIRKLSKQSKDSLITSFEKIKLMSNVISNSTSLSDEVTNTLNSIINESKTTAGMINHITDLITEQKAQSTAIMQAIHSLLEDSLAIKELSSKARDDNEKIKSTLTALNNSFVAITDLLKEQQSREKDLYNSIDQIKEVMSENLNIIGLLNESIK